MTKLGAGWLSPRPLSATDTMNEHLPAYGPDITTPVSMAPVWPMGVNSTAGAGASRYTALTPALHGKKMLNWKMFPAARRRDVALVKLIISALSGNTTPAGRVVGRGSAAVRNVRPLMPVTPGTAGTTVTPLAVGLTVIRRDVVALAVVGLAVVGLAVVGLAVVALAVVGLAVVGLAVVALVVARVVVALVVVSLAVVALAVVAFFVVMAASADR